MPAGKVGATDVSDFSCAHQSVERAQGLLHGRLRVKSVQLKEVKVIGPQAFQRLFNGANQVKSRRADIVRSVPDTERRLRGNKNSVTLASNGLPEDFFGHAVGITVRAIKHGHPGV